MTNPNMNNDLETKMSTMDIDLREFSKETLINFIIIAHDYDLTFNETFVKILSEAVENYENDENQLPLL